MKKNLFLIIGLFAIGLISFNSCKKEVTPTSLELNMTRTATITGFVKADLVQDSAGTEMPMEYAPAGTKLIVKVALSEYNNDAPYGEYKTFETTVGTDGTYSFEVPADENGVAIQVMGVDFQYDYKKYKWEYNSDYTVRTWVADGTTKKAYSVTPLNINVVSGGNYINGMTYVGTEM